MIIQQTDVVCLLVCYALHLSKSYTPPFRRHHPAAGAGLTLKDVRNSIVGLPGEGSGSMPLRAACQHVVDIALLISRCLQDLSSTRSFIHHAKYCTNAIHAPTTPRAHRR